MEALGQTIHDNHCAQPCARFIVYPDGFTPCHRPCRRQRLTRFAQLFGRCPHDCLAHDPSFPPGDVPIGLVQSLPPPPPPPPSGTESTSAAGALALVQKTHKIRKVEGLSVHGVSPASSSSRDPFGKTLALDHPFSEFGPVGPTDPSVWTATIAGNTTVPPGPSHVEIPGPRCYQQCAYHFYFAGCYVRCSGRCRRHASHHLYDGTDNCDCLAHATYTSYQPCTASSEEIPMPGETDDIATSLIQLRNTITKSVQSLPSSENRVQGQNSLCITCCLFNPYATECHLAPTCIKLGCKSAPASGKHLSYCSSCKPTGLLGVMLPECVRPCHHPACGRPVWDPGRAFCRDHILSPTTEDTIRRFVSCDRLSTPTTSKDLVQPPRDPVPCVIYQPPSNSSSPFNIVTVGTMPSIASNSGSVGDDGAPFVFARPRHTTCAQHWVR